MRVRPLSPTGDYQIGVPFYTNCSQAVEQAIYTRLRLWLGEWFVDVTDGTPYLTGVLGERYAKNPDAAIKARILGTPGVESLTAYSSTFDGTSRTLTVNATVQTIYQSNGLKVNFNLKVSPPAVTPPPPPPPPPPPSGITLAIAATLRPATVGGFSLGVQQVVILNTSPLPIGVVGQPYSVTLLASGTAPFAWAITGGAVDAGLSLNASTGALSGVPVAASTYSFTAQVTDATLQSASMTFSLTTSVYPTISDATLRAAGYILVDDYGARADGVTDSTAAINNAIVAGIAQFKPVWFKNGGDYMVSSSVLAYQWIGTSASGVQMPSLCGASYPTRARIRIFDNSTWFGSASHYEPLIIFRTFQDPTNSLTPPANNSFDPLSTPAGWTEVTPDNGFGALYANIDMHFGNGNPGAAGLFAQLAQSNHIQHCAVNATGGGFCGFLSLPVEGSGCCDLSVTGGKYGVYGSTCRGIGGNPSYSGGIVGSHISGLTCTGQTVACLSTGGFMSSSVTGFYFAPAAGALAVQFNTAGRAGDGGLFLHDGQVVMSGGGNPIAFSNVGTPQVNFSLHNVYVSGTTNLVKTGSNATITGSGSYPLIVDYHAATSSTVNATSGVSPTQSIIDGVVTSVQEPYTVVNGANSTPPPADLLTRHVFQLPQIDNGAYIDITQAPYNCVSAASGHNQSVYTALNNASAVDGFAAITQAISDAATAGHNRVFVPNGAFCVSNSPVLGANTVFFGTTLAHSQIMPIKSWAPSSGNPPVITTVSNAAGTTQLVNICVVRPMTRGTVTTYNGNTVYSGNRFNGVNWQVGRNSIMAAVFLENDYQANGYAGLPRQILAITGNGGGRFYSMAYREEDYCNQDTQMIPLQISGTSEPIWIYGNNVEFGDKVSSTGPPPITNIQIANASNVRIFNTKREGHAPTVVITNSSNIGYYVVGKLGGAVDNGVPLSDYPGTTYYSQGYVDSSSNNLLLCDWSLFFNDGGQAGHKILVDVGSGATLDYLTQLCVYKKGVINDAAMARSTPAPGNTSLSISATLSNVVPTMAVTTPVVANWAFRSIGTPTYSYTTTITPGMPPTYSVGDLLVLCAGEYLGNDAPPDAALAAQGWKRQSVNSFASNSVYVKFAVGSSASPNLAADQPTYGFRGTAYNNFGVMLAYYGGPSTLTGILNVANDGGKYNTVGEVYVAGLSAPSQNNCLVLNFSLNDVPTGVSSGLGTYAALPNQRGGGFIPFGSGGISWCVEDVIQTTAAAISQGYHTGGGWTETVNYNKASTMVALNV